MSRRNDLVFVAAAMAASAILIVPTSGLAAQGWTSAQRNDEAMVVGSGRVVRQARPVADFRRLEAQGATNVQIRVGVAPSLIVEADHNLMPYITSKVSDGTLVLDTRGSFRTRNPIRVYVTVPNIEHVVTSGSGNVNIQGVANRRLELVTRGSGNLLAQGRTGELKVTVQGSGNANMRGLQSSRAEVSVMGSGNAWVSTSGAVTARSHGSGNVFVGGTPSSVDVTEAGSGRVSVRRTN
jgi:hypothetical protein